MKVSWKCACCGRPQNKITEFTLGQAFKPQMFRCFDTWLKRIQQDLDWKNEGNPKRKKLERVELTLDTLHNEPKKVPWVIQEKYVPENKREKKIRESDKVGWEDEFTTYNPADAWKDWANINPYFKQRKGESEASAKIRVMEWTADPKGIKYNECRDWINAGFKGEDFDLVRWLRGKGITADIALNHGSYEEYKAQFKELTADKDDKDDNDTE